MRLSCVPQITVSINRYGEEIATRFVYFSVLEESARKRARLQPGRGNLEVYIPGRAVEDIVGGGMGGENVWADRSYGGLQSVQMCSGI